MNATAFLSKMNEWVSQNTIIFVAMADPDSFIPRCSHRAIVATGTKDYTLNWDDASLTLRIYDEGALRNTLTGTSQLASAIATQTDDTQPESIYDAFVTVLGDPEAEVPKVGVLEE